MSKAGKEAGRRVEVDQEAGVGAGVVMLVEAVEVVVVVGPWVGGKIGDTMIVIVVEVVVIVAVEAVAEAKIARDINLILFQY